MSSYKRKSHPSNIPPSVKKSPSRVTRPKRTQRKSTSAYLHLDRMAQAKYLLLMKVVDCVLNSAIAVSNALADKPRSERLRFYGLLRPLWVNLGKLAATRAVLNHDAHLLNYLEKDPKVDTSRKPPRSKKK